uniref:Integrase zinc-binding domain-containing protein n=1 Tax=Romanomermis culicivorax TaxID=13658 RepID=A0A915L2Y5_ROMCU
MIDLPVKITCAPPKLSLQAFDYDYKVEYIKGKDNACTNFLSQKNECEKPPVLSTEELATKIFHPQFCSTSWILDADPMVTNISLVGILPQALIDMDINTITCAMTKQPIDQTTLSRPMLPMAPFKPPPVEAMAIARQAEIWTAQNADPTISKIVEVLQTANTTRQPSVFFTKDGILYRQAKDQRQLILPALPVDQTLHQFHSAKIFNHQGSTCMLAAIKNHLWWPVWKKLIVMTNTAAKRDKSHCGDSHSHDSHDHNRSGTARHHGTQSEQTGQVHSTHFYESRLGICVTIAIHIRATNTSLAICQYFWDHYHPSYLEPHPPKSPNIATLILRWVSGIWDEELGCVEPVQNTHFTLFFYEAHGLDNQTCLVQAYNIAISLMDSWMA